MLKYILFVLSGYYSEIVRKRRDELEENIRGQAPGPEVLIKRIPAGSFAAQEESTALPEADPQSTLLITDCARAAGYYREAGWYVAVLYHDGNRQEPFPAVRYGIEDLFALERSAFEEVYRRLAGLPWEILETERLKVRESTLSDVEDFYRIYQDPSITRYMENLFPEKEAEQAYMKAYIDQIYGFYGYGMWSVLLKESGRVIGRAGLSVREGYDIAELGFVIETCWQRRGLAFEVCSAILDYARRELGFDRVQALVREENLISKRLLARLGFFYEKKVREKDGEYELHIVSLRSRRQEEFIQN